MAQHQSPLLGDGPLMVFDGYCGLCSRAVQFVLRHDRNAVFRYVPAQTPLGTAIYQQYGLDAQNYETFILVCAGRGYFASDAAIELARRLPFPWSLGVALGILPKRWRDGLYFLVARNRMRLFGRSVACYLPSPENRSRFLSGNLDDQPATADAIASLR